MTNEEKQLLLADLCARLPYDVKVLVDYIDESNIIETLNCHHIIGLKYWNGEDGLISIKPYLRPLYSITEEEKEYLEELSEFKCTPDKATKKIDFYLSHHIDYRGLIPMGLALEAPEGMYH